MHARTRIRTRTRFICSNLFLGVTLRNSNSASLTAVSWLLGCIIVFYKTRRKSIIKVGSSTTDPHPVLQAVHAEENAIKNIKHYLKKYDPKKIKDLTIIIWRQNNHGELKSINCCKWCKAKILKAGIKPNQIITPCVNADGTWNHKVRSAITDCPSHPVLKKNN